MPGNHGFLSQKPSRPTADPILNGYQLPPDINFRRLYDAIKIITNDLKELRLAVEAILQPESVSFITQPDGSGELTGQNLKRTQNFDIMKRISIRF